MKQSTSLNNLFNIYPHEVGRVTYLFLTYFIFALGTVWASNIINAEFLAEVGLEFLPLLFVIQALATIPIIGIFTAFVDHVPIQRMLLIVLGMTSVAIFIALALLTAGVVGAAYLMLFVVQAVSLTAFLMQWWNYFDEFYDTLTAKRIVPIVAGAFQLGTIVGGFSLRYINTIIQPQFIIMIWAVVLFLVGILIWYLPRYFNDDIDLEHGRTSLSGSYGDSLREGYGYIVESPFLRWTSTSAFLLIIFMDLLDYGSKEILLANFTNAEDYANFTSTLQGVINLVMLPIQFFLFSRIITRFGVENTNLLFPVLSIVVAISVVFFPPVVVIGALGFFDRTGLRDNFQSPLEILMFNTVSMRIKGRAGAVIEGFVKPIGAIVGGALLFVLPMVSDEFGIYIALALFALLYAGAAFGTQQKYTDSLLKTLQEEDFSFLLENPKEVAITDPTMLNWLVQKLAEAENHKQALFLAGLICQAGSVDQAAILVNVARHTDDIRLRQGLYDLLIATGWKNKDILTLYELGITHANGQIRRSALLGLQAIGQLTLERAQAFHNDPELDVRVVALELTAQQLLPDQQTELWQQIESLFADEYIEHQRAALGLFDRLHHPQRHEKFLLAIQSSDDRLRQDGALALVRHPHRLEDDVVSALLNDPVDTIREYGVQIVVRESKNFALLAPYLTDPSQAVRETLITLANQAQNKEAARRAWDSAQMDAGNHEQKKRITLALAKLYPQQYTPMFKVLIDGDLKMIYQNFGWIAALSPYTGHMSITVLIEVLLEHIEQLRYDIFEMLAITHQYANVTVIQNGLASDSTRANAQEALESISSPQFAQWVGQTYDQTISPHDLYQSYFGKSPADIGNALVSFYNESEHYWGRCIALVFASYMIDEIPEGVLILEQGLLSGSSDLVEAAFVGQAKSKNEGVMSLSRIEKVIFLKQVSLFENLSIQQLQVLADICTEERFEKDQTIFKQGELGDSMYIIVNGEVGIDLENTEHGEMNRIAIRGVNDAFGEMSLFDAETRSASVVPIKDTLTLRIEGQHLKKIARKHPDLLLSFINVLSGRLREASNRLGELESRIGEN